MIICILEKLTYAQNFCASCNDINLCCRRTPDFSKAAEAFEQSACKYLFALTDCAIAMIFNFLLYIRDVNKNTQVIRVVGEKSDSP